MDLIVEEFYNGHEIDVEVLMQNNCVKLLTIADNSPSIAPYFLEQGDICPSIFLTENEKTRIETVLKHWLPHMNIRNGIVHFEAKCKALGVNGIDLKYLDDTDFLMPIEINLRLGGSQVWTMNKTAYDIDLLEEALKIALNIDLNSEDLERKYKNPRYQVISKNFHADKNVIFDSIEIDLKELNSDPDAIEYLLDRSEDKKLTLRDSFGFMTVSSAYSNRIFPCDYMDLKCKLKRIKDYVKVKFIEKQ